MNQLHFSQLLKLKAPILITGQTGTGKSFLAREIFNQSTIYKEKFLTVHLASLKEDLLESELFGHKKGAFTGANENRKGYLEEVGRGTLFLDEIGELSLEAQKKLLYLLEEKKFTLLGSHQAQDFQGRILMATNKNLEQMVANKLFREDLYFRIKTFSYHLEPLSSGSYDKKNLIDSLFSELKKKYQYPYSKISPEAYEALMTYSFAGNIRELKHAIEFGLAINENGVITPSHLPLLKSSIVSEQNGDNADAFIASLPKDFNESFAVFEELFLIKTLTENEGKINESARRMGMSKTSLISKVKKYKIDAFKMRYDASMQVA